MSDEQLQNLVKVGSLKAEEPDENEIEGPIRSGLRRLNDAAHSLALAALRSRGFRPEKRYIVFQCLEHTVGLPREQWKVLDLAHNKRNRAEYEGEVDVEEQLVASLTRIAREVANRL